MSKTEADDYPHALRAELQRRIAELATTSETSDDTFGRLGLGDAILVVALCVLAPALVIWIGR